MKSLITSTIGRAPLVHRASAHTATRTSTGHSVPSLPLSHLNSSVLEEVGRLRRGALPELRRVSEHWAPLLQAHAEQLSMHGSHAMDTAAKYNEFVALTLKTALMRYRQALERCDSTTIESDEPLLDPEYADALKRQSAEAFRSLLSEDPRRALAYASCIDPRLHAAFGIELDPAQRRTVEALHGVAGHRALSEAEVLAMRNYVHPRTGTFNLQRAVHLLERHVPGESLSTQVRPLLEPFDRAVEWLATSPAARIEPDALYKGLTLPTAFASEWLESHVGQSRPMPIDWPTSVTTNPIRSYAGLRSYAHEVVFRGGAAAVDVSNFHPEQTLYDQDEALLLPGQAFALTERSLETGSDHGFVRYVAELMPPTEP